jgi:hypothetical protein
MSESFPLNDWTDWQDREIQNLKARAKELEAEANRNFLAAADALERVEKLEAELDEWKLRAIGIPLREGQDE